MSSRSIASVPPAVVAAARAAEAASAPTSEPAQAAASPAEPGQTPATPSGPPMDADSARTFRPIEDEIRELERTRMIEALAATGGVQNRAAELIQMPLRTFVTKLKRYAITPSDWRDAK